MLGSLNHETILQHKLIRPTDRYGKEVKDRWTTKEAEDALKEYKDAVGGHNFPSDLLPQGQIPALPPVNVAMISKRHRNTTSRVFRRE